MSDNDGAAAIAQASIMHVQDVVLLSAWAGEGSQDSSRMILHLAALLLMHATDSGTDLVAGDLQILQRAPRMADFRMASSRVGAEGGIALAQGLSIGQHTPPLLCSLHIRSQK